MPYFLPVSFLVQSTCTQPSRNDVPQSTELARNARSLVKAGPLMQGQQCDNVAPYCSPQCQSALAASP